MKNKMRIIAILMGLILISTVVAYDTFDLQGVLRNASTGTLINGSETFNLTIYNQSDNSRLYSEEAARPVTNGTWNYIIGIDETLVANLFQSPVYYILSVGGDALTPQNFSYTPRSFYAEFAVDSGQLGGQVPSYYLDDTNTDTNASSFCSGTTTYLDGEGNCDDISGVYEAEGDYYTGTQINATIPLIKVNNATHADHCSALLGTVSIHNISDPVTDQTFSFGGNTLEWQFSNPASDGFVIDGIGAFSGDLMHIHQHTGNPSAVTLLRLHADDPDVIPFQIEGTAGTAINISFGNITIIDGQVYASGWDNVSITESQVSDLSHTVDTNTDTNASSFCSGTTTYLDGEGNCDDISLVYQTNITNQACSGSDKFSGYDNGVFTCTADAAGGGGGAGVWAVFGSEIAVNTSATGGVDDINISGILYVNGEVKNLSLGWGNLTNVPTGLDDGDDDTVIQNCSGATCDITNIGTLDGYNGADLLDNTDTNASSFCSGTTTYLDGEGNCDDISSVYVQAADWTTIDDYPAACSAGDYVHTIGDTLTCSTPSYTTDTYNSTVDIWNVAGNYTLLRNYTSASMTELTITTNLTIVSSNIYHNGSGICIGSC